MYLNPTGNAAGRRCADRQDECHCSKAHANREHVFTAYLHITENPLIGMSDIRFGPNANLYPAGNVGAETDGFPLNWPAVVTNG